MKNLNITRVLALAAMVLLVGSGAAVAQLQTGNLYGTVVDEQGAPLPGVTATLTGGGAPQVQVTNAQGQFRFLGLGPGSYALKAELEGFSTVDYPSIVINVGRNTQIEITLSAAVEDVITVTAESPLLDERRISTGATVAQTELEKIPTARDPWAILQTTPGVLTDRINVGGNESGQQSQYVGPGSAGDQAVWSVDGMVITDMAALGSSPAYYDFDAFEEMQATTGGSDATIATGGVVLNMVTKRGTNEWRGSGRYYLTDESNQSDLDFDRNDLARAGPFRSGSGATNGQASFKQGNRIVEVKDFGAELGGPIVKDRLWIWGSYGKNEIDLLTISDVSDFTELESTNAKLNAQLAPNNSATAFYFDSDKIKLGRNAGPTRPQETTWNQSGFGPVPTAYKVEDTHIFSSNFYLTGMYSKVNGGFQLVPRGGVGPTDPTTVWNVDGIWHNNFLLYQTERPQDQYKADASHFFNTGNLSHELKFGAGYREAEVTTLSRWPGGGYVIGGPLVGLPAGINYFGAARDSALAVKQEYTSIYAQDTMTTGNLTVNVGLRYDNQEATNLAATAQAHSTFSNILPQVSQGGFDAGFSWESITPRLGLTYALGSERKTLLRASFSRFADQLGTGVATWLNPLSGPGYAYFYVTSPVDGSPNSRQVTPSEIFSGPNSFSANVNPYTGGLLNSNRVDPGLDAPITDELLFSVEHALLPEFVVGLNLTYRKITDILESELLVFDGAPCNATFDPLQCASFSRANMNNLGRVHTRNDYVRNTINQAMPDGSTRTLEVWSLRDGVSTRGGGLLENGDREQEYTGASVTFNKRLANRWMLRGNVTWADWEWSDVPNSELENPTRGLGGGDRTGDPVLQGSGTGSGSKGGIYINSEWSYSVNGMYQIAPDRPWGFNVAANLTGREGYPVPYFRRVTQGANQNFVRDFVQATNAPDEFRHDDIHVFDARVEKEFTFSDFGLTLGVDVFNVFNEAYVLQRTHRLQLSTSNNVTEVLSPRIIRFGLRLSFR